MSKTCIHIWPREMHYTESTWLNTLSFIRNYWSTLGMHRNEFTILYLLITWHRITVLFPTIFANRFWDIFKFLFGFRSHSDAIRYQIIQEFVWKSYIIFQMLRKLLNMASEISCFRYRCIDKWIVAESSISVRIFHCKATGSLLSNELKYDLMQPSNPKTNF